MVGGGFFVLFTKDFIVDKQLVELFKFIPRSKKGLENLVNGEEDESEPKKDVGVERDEGVDCRITIFFPTIVTAVIFNPIGIVFGIIFGKNSPIVIPVCVSFGNIDIGIGLSTLIIL